MLIYKKFVNKPEKNHFVFIKPVFCTENGKILRIKMHANTIKYLTNVDFNKNFNTINAN